MNLPGDLDRALRGVLADVPPRQLSHAVDTLIDTYRRGVDSAAPLLRRRADVIAYAAYRMPATYAAVRAALGEFAALAPSFAPRSHLDLGGGTGAAAWAVADVWPAVRDVTVLDWSEPALGLGRELARGSALLGHADWRGQEIGAALPEAPDLVTLSYVLNELSDEDRRRVVADVLRRDPAVVAVVEPGTPAGYGRVIEARDQLVEAGLTVAAPCPHSLRCPMEPGRDWCHFAVRLQRSALHRQVKGGSLGFEDEKFSYVIASREPVRPAASRVVRHPLQRKGMVTLQLCAREEGLRRAVVTKKRHGDLYRAARDTSWGDPWPPPGEGSGPAAPERAPVPSPL
ncbi:small ribosomal subunit Rsm22 family protein [Streptomyces capparidis]